jgi:hypothetical protein
MRRNAERSPRKGRQTPARAFAARPEKLDGSFQSATRDATNGDQIFNQKVHVGSEMMTLGTSKKLKNSVHRQGWLLVN